MTSSDAAAENPLASDLDAVIEAARNDLEQMRGASMFITGGTGFVGRWLLETLVRANARLNLGVTVMVLSRDPAAFSRRAPHLVSAPGVSLCQGDVRSFELPREDFTHVVHAATESSTQLALENPDEMYEVIVRGTERVMELAETRGVRRLLYLSSGAVYGHQSSGVSVIHEDFARLQEAPFNVYAEGKRVAEDMLCSHASTRGYSAAIARLFTLIGPFMSFEHHAIGNFIRDAVAGGPIRVQGDGKPVRSYLYASDMTAWLIAVLVRGQSQRAYNVGSEKWYTVAQVAALVADAMTPGLAVEVEGDWQLIGAGGSQYVPSTRRIRNELGVRESVDLATAVHRTIEWYCSGRT